MERPREVLYYDERLEGLFLVGFTTPSFLAAPVYPHRERYRPSPSIESSRDLRAKDDAGRP